ncbi:MAG: beta-methylgalactoside transporter [Bacillota bacterium]|nr:beta-methylgalactoside transporter [Bacillota bacterium]
MEANKNSTAAAKPRITRKQIANKLIDNLLYIILLIYIIGVTITSPRFLSFGSIVNIITNTSFRLPIALGIGGIIVLTGTDLSAGRIVGLTACIVASLTQRLDYPSKMFPELGDMNLLFVLLIVMVVGGLIGSFNGYFVARFKLHPFIVTLSTALIVYAMSLAYIKLGTNAGKPLGGLRPEFADLITGGITLFGIRIQFIVFYAIALVGIMWFIWNHTVIGKNMFAVGCNPEAANVSGISVTKTIVTVFTIAGVLYGINGYITSAFVGSNNAATGFNFELDAIAACVIGGVSFSGGVGKISGIVLGVVLLQLITASFIFLGVDANLQYAIKGVVILIATAIDMRKYVAKR